MPEVDFADQPKQWATEAGEKVSSQFKEILKFAHFNYDSKKIHFRQEDKVQGSKQSKTERGKLGSKILHDKVSNIRRKARIIVQLQPETVCPICGYEPLKQTKAVSKRFIVDLVCTKNGIKKTVSEYNGFRASCPKCGKTFAPLDIRKFPSNQVYGHGFGAWVVYQRVALHLPYKSIIESAFEQFGEDLGASQPIHFLQQFAQYYALTEKMIVNSLLVSIVGCKCPMARRPRCPRIFGQSIPGEDRRTQFHRT